MIQLIVGCIAFHSAFSKTKLKFKMWFLVDLLIKFLFQALLGRGNESRMQRNRMALELWCLNSSIISKNSRAVFSVEEQVNLKGKLGVTVRWMGALRSTIAITCLLIETVSRIRPIADGAPRWVHVFKWRDASLVIIRWIFIQRSWCLEESTDRDKSQPL